MRYIANMRNKVDPIHFFDRHGDSVLSKQQSEVKLAEAQAEIIRLKDLIRSMVAKERAKIISQIQHPFIH